MKGMGSEIRFYQYLKVTSGKESERFFYQHTVIPNRRHSADIESFLKQLMHDEDFLTSWIRLWQTQGGEATFDL